MALAKKESGSPADHLSSTDNGKCPSLYYSTTNYPLFLSNSVLVQVIKPFCLHADAF